MGYQDSDQVSLNKKLVVVNVPGSDKSEEHQTDNRTVVGSNCWRQTFSVMVDTRKGA